MARLFSTKNYLSIFLKGLKVFGKDVYLSNINVINNENNKVTTNNITKKTNI